MATRTWQCWERSQHGARERKCDQSGLIFARWLMAGEWLVNVKPGCAGVVSTINSGNRRERSLYLSRRLPQVRDRFESDSIRWRTYGHTPSVQAFHQASSATKPAWKRVWKRFWKRLGRWLLRPFPRFPASYKKTERRQ